MPVSVEFEAPGVPKFVNAKKELPSKNQIPQCSKTSDKGLGLSLEPKKIRSTVMLAVESTTESGRESMIDKKRHQ